MHTYLSSWLLKKNFYKTKLKTIKHIMNNQYTYGEFKA